MFLPPPSFNFTYVLPEMYKVLNPHPWDQGEEGKGMEGMRKESEKEKEREVGGKPGRGKGKGKREGRRERRREGKREG